MIKITIENKHCTVLGAPVIVCGNSTYTITFTFDEEWAQAEKKTARFSYVRDGVRRYKDVELIGNTVAVPPVYKTKQLQVGVYAGDLVTTTPARIPCEKSIVCDSCGPDELDPSQYEKLAADAAAAATTAVVDKFCPPFTASGAVVTCSPVEGYPLGVVSKIVPKQSGTGDPTPDNVRPISGHTAVNLKRCGKNLINPVEYMVDSNQTTLDGDVFTTNFTSGGLYVNRGWNYGYKTHPKGTYTVTLFPLTEGATCDFFIYSASTKSSIARKPSASATDPSFTFTVNEEFYISVAGDYKNQGTYSYKLQLEEGKTATTYEPYQGETVTLNLGQTVYFGELNWNTGVLTVNQYNRVVLDGVSNWAKCTATDSGATTYAYLEVKGRLREGSTAYNNKIHVNVLNLTSPMAIVFVSPSVSGVVESDNSTIVANKINAVLKSWYDAGEPAEFLYETDAQPITLQLTPQEITALSGVNTIYADTGDITITGKADPVAIIADLYDKINQLQAAAVNNA